MHPGHSLVEVQEHTGFSFDVPDNVEVTAAPTETELVPEGIRCLSGLAPTAAVWLELAQIGP